MESIISWSKDWDGGEIAGDRRGDRRYRIRLDVRWKLIRRKKVQDVGTGRTLDLSSGGVLFEATRELPVGLNVELSIAWPVLLHAVAPMQMVAYGRIVRSNGLHVGVRMTQHEFRTMSTASAEREGSLPPQRTSARLLQASGTGFGRY